MKIVDFSISIVARIAAKIGEKKSLIVKLSDEEGKVGYGEISPLASRSLESFDEALKYTLEVKKKWSKGDYSPAPLPPSVLFGLSSALIDLQQPEFTPISFTKTHLSFPDDEVKEGIANVKIKTTPSLDETFLRVRKWLDKGALVRLDMNASWNVDQAISFVNRFKPGELLYVEDPVPFRSLDRFIAETNVAIAVDEPLAKLALDVILLYDCISYWIIKPTLLGGYQECREIVERGKQAGKKIVFSSSFETIFGLSHIVRLGKSLDCQEPFGVDTVKYFDPPLLPGEEEFDCGVVKPFNRKNFEQFRSLSYQAAFSLIS